MWFSHHTSCLSLFFVIVPPSALCKAIAVTPRYQDGLSTEFTPEPLPTPFFQGLSEAPRTQPKHHQQINLISNQVFRVKFSQSKIRKNRIYQRKICEKYYCELWCILLSNSLYDSKNKCILSRKKYVVI